MTARIVITLLMVIVIDVYAFQVFKTLGRSSAPWVQRAINVAYWSIPAFIGLLTLLTLARIEPQWGRNVVVYGRAFFFLLYIAKFLMAGVLLMGDAVAIGAKLIDWVSGNRTALADAGRRQFVKNLALAAGAIPFGTLVYGMVRNAYRYTVERVAVKIDNLPDALEGLKIVQISDVHSGSFTFKEPVKHAIDLINGEAADLVFFTGDLVNDRSDEMLPYIDVFDKITAKHGVFSVLGNHDYGDYAQWNSDAEKAENLEQLKRIHGQLGWQLLLNENRILTINGAQLGIIGVENWSAKGRFRSEGDLAKAYTGVESAAVKLLLSHDPSHWDAEVNQAYKDIDVTFSGHTHGMQFGVKIPGLINWSPSKYLYKQWAGLYQKGKQYIYVNRGLGFLGYPGRVGMLPEITVLELQKA